MPIVYPPLRPGESYQPENPGQAFLRVAEIIAAGLLRREEIARREREFEEQRALEGRRVGVLERGATTAERAQETEAALGGRRVTAEEQRVALEREGLSLRERMARHEAGLQNLQTAVNLAQIEGLGRAPEELIKPGEGGFPTLTLPQGFSIPTEVQREVRTYQELGLDAPTALRLATARHKLPVLAAQKQLELLGVKVELAEEQKKLIAANVARYTALAGKYARSGLLGGEGAGKEITGTVTAITKALEESKAAGQSIGSVDIQVNGRSATVPVTQEWFQRLVARSAESDDLAAITAEVRAALADSPEAKARAKDAAVLYEGAKSYTSRVEDKDTGKVSYVAQEQATAGEPPEQVLARIVQIARGRRKEAIAQFYSAFSENPVAALPLLQLYGKELGMDLGMGVGAPPGAGAGAAPPPALDQFLLGPNDTSLEREAQDLQRQLDALRGDETELDEDLDLAPPR